MDTRAWRACVLVLFAACGLAGAPASAEEEASDDPAPSALLLKTADADRFWVFPESAEVLGSGGEFHVYLDAQTHPEAGASFARFDLGPSGSLPEHKHEKTEEFSYFLSGEGVVTIDEEGEPREVPVRPGTVWYNPKGAWHAVRNTGDEPLAIVFATVPNVDHGLLSFFRRIGVEPGDEPQPLSPEELARIAAEHDLILRRVPAESFAR